MSLKDKAPWLAISCVKAHCMTMKIPSGACLTFWGPGYVEAILMQDAADSWACLVSLRSACAANVKQEAMNTTLEDPESGAAVDSSAAPDVGVQDRPMHPAAVSAPLTAQPSPASPPALVAPASAAAAMLVSACAGITPAGAAALSVPPDASFATGPAAAGAAPGTSLAPEPMAKAESLMAHAQKSIYGTFTKALDDANLKSLPLDLPSVVVIGNQSVGKSSLLENILKCSIFPADQRECTRVPMRLKLVHVTKRADVKILVEHDGKEWWLESRAQVLARVTAIMRSITRRSFQDTEVQVTVWEVSDVRQLPSCLV